MQSSALKLYPSFEQKAMLLKRQAFAVFSGEIDQYHLYLPLIQGKICNFTCLFFSTVTHINYVRKEYHLFSNTYFHFKFMMLWISEF